MSAPASESEPLRSVMPIPADGPGMRTLRSSRFRAIVAGVLLVAWVPFLSAHLVSTSTDPTGQFGIDFPYWYGAALDVAAGMSPYPPRYLEGPVSGLDFGYKYPPTFAQALVPLTALSLADATLVWALMQAGLGFLSVWLASLFGGARRTLEHALWSGLAAALFLPYFSSVYFGNVSVIQAFQISLVLAGGAMAGAALTTAVLLKSTPFALVPAALRRGGALRLALVLSGLALGALSFMLSPGAWVDFLLIQPNLFFGSHPTVLGLQPAGLAANLLPELPLVSDLVRGLTLLLAVVALGSSIMLARRPGGWPTAVVLGVTVALAVPGAIWYHYLAMLLPLAAFAWPRATRLQRLMLLGASVGVSLAIASSPLATVSSTAMIVVILWILVPGAIRSQGDVATPAYGRSLAQTGAEPSR